MGLQIQQTPFKKARMITTIIAAFALVAQPLYGLVNSQVANALTRTTIEVSPSSLAVQAGSTASASTGAAGFHDLKLAFKYDVRELEANDQLSYGWSVGDGANNSLSAVHGQEGSKQGEVSSVTDITLPAGAEVNNLRFNFSNKGTASSDSVFISNIALTGIKNALPVLDLTPPSITFTDPVRFNDASYNKRFAVGPSIAVRASDASSVENVVLHAYSADGRANKRCWKTVAGDVASCDTSSFEQGDYYVKVAATDGAGRTAYTKKDFMIDTTKPWAELKDSSVGSVSQKILKEADVKLHDDRKIVAYTINDTRVAVSAKTTGSGDANDIKVGSRYGVYGENVLTVEDAAGNVSDPLTFTLDNVAPTATVNHRSTGADTVFSKVFYDLYDAHKIDKVTINGVEKNLTDNNWSNVDGIIPDKFGAIKGDNTLVVYDVAGNSRKYTFFLDHDAPTIIVKNATLNSPDVPEVPNNSTISTVKQKELRLFTTDNDVDHILMDGNEKWSGPRIMGDGGVDIAYITSGTHMFQAVDKAGNVSNEITLTFDNEGPAVTIDSPTSGTVTSNNGLAVRGTVDTSDISGVDRVVVVVKDLTSDTQKTLPTDLNGSEWTINLDKSLLPDGHTIRIVAYAKDGLKNTGKTTSVEVAVDNTSPVTTLRLTSSSTPSASTPLTFTGSVDELSTLKSLALFVNTKQIADLTDDTLDDGNWTYTLDAGLPKGKYDISAVVTDIYGNMSKVALASKLNVGAYATPNKLFKGTKSISLILPLSTPNLTPPLRTLANATPVVTQPVTTESDSVKRDSSVLGTETAKDTADTPAIAASDSGWKFFGIAWYWWLLFLAILAAMVSWLNVLRRRKQMA